MRYIFLIIMVLTSFFAAAAERDKHIEEEANIQMAENALLWSLIAARSQEGIRACAENQLACSYNSDADLGLIILAQNNSEYGLLGLSNAVRFSLDAGVAEDYSCYLLEKGKKIVPILSKLNTENLEKKCIKEFNSVLEKSSGKFGDVKLGNICNTKASMDYQIRETIDAIKKHVVCDEDWISIN